MSLEEKHDSASDEMRDNETNHKDERTFELEIGGQSPCKQQCELPSYSLLSEMEESDERSDNPQQETEELNINTKLTMLQNVFKTVGADLEDIKALMLRLREILGTDRDREIRADLNRQRDCPAGESSKEVIVIDDDDEDEPMQLPHEASKESGSTTDSSSTEPLFDSSKYSNLVADIEVLKNKLVSLKRNLAE